MVVAPVEDFSDVVKKIAHGEFDAELPEIKSQDELWSTTVNKERIESELRIAQPILTNRKISSPR